MLHFFGGGGVGWVGSSIYILYMTVVHIPSYLLGKNGKYILVSPSNDAISTLKA